MRPGIITPLLLESAANRGKSREWNVKSIAEVSPSLSFSRSLSHTHTPHEKVSISPSDSLFLSLSLSRSLALSVSRGTSVNLSNSGDPRVCAVSYQRGTPVEVGILTLPRNQKLSAAIFTSASSLRDRLGERDWDRERERGRDGVGEIRRERYRG